MQTDTCPASSVWQSAVAGAAVQRPSHAARGWQTCTVVHCALLCDVHCSVLKITLWCMSFKPSQKECRKISQENLSSLHHGNFQLVDARLVLHEPTPCACVGLFCCDLLQQQCCCIKLAALTLFLTHLLLIVASPVLCGAASPAWRMLSAALLQSAPLASSVAVCAHC